MVIDAPCRNCKDRVLGCHDKCERYSAYRKRLDEIREKDKERRKEEELNGRHFKRRA